MYANLTCFMNEQTIKTFDTKNMYLLKIILRREL